jgi:putative ABC transport system permease protein
MITSTLVIYNQLNFLRNKELGFDHENLVVIDINSTILRRDAEIIKGKFASLHEVQSVATSTRVPGEWKLFPVATVRSETQSEGEAIWVGIDESFLDTYKIELVAGRNFVAGKSDSTKVILTELAVKELGLFNPVGKWVEIPRTRRGGSIEDLEAPFRVEIIGVVKDFHFESFRSQMMPLIFGAATTVIQPIDYYTLRISTTDWPATIEKLKALNATIDADNPLEYNFLDSKFEEFYAADEKRASIFLVFSIIVVLIACLGLFALVSYSIESRIKEIGIRKVLGASVENIVGIICKEYLMLVLGGAMLAVPVSWYFMNQWLREFAYNTGVPAVVYVVAIVVALVIAFATISVRTIKAAIVNPVKTLRAE